jgi:cobalt-zinc-cadmium efflux system protein
VVAVSGPWRIKNRNNITYQWGHTLTPDTPFVLPSPMMGHGHSHAPAYARTLDRAFKAGIALNLGFVIVEAAAGFMTNSLALLSDAGHNLSDVATLALSLFAFKVSKRKATTRFTYGFHKSTILVSLVNAVVLLIAVGSIGWEAILRFMDPVPIPGQFISIVAAIGIVINVASALLFFREKEKEINARGAYLHLALDAAVSAGVALGGIAISFSGFAWIDPMLSLLIMAVVTWSTWSLLKESLRLSMDAVPAAIDVEEIRQKLLSVGGVKDIYHIHVWAISTTRNAMTAHVVFGKKTSMEEGAAIKERLKHLLAHFNIDHATLETEFEA